MFNKPTSASYQFAVTSHLHPSLIFAARVEPLSGLHSHGRLLALAANITQGWK